MGLALATSSLAEPYRVIRSETTEEAIRKINQVVAKEKIEKIVVGVSEGVMAEETRKFGNKLKKVVNLPLVFQDETLSTKIAKTLSMEAGIRRKKRKELEDAYSATLILQDYLDSRL